MNNGYIVRRDVDVEFFGAADGFVCTNTDRERVLADLSEMVGDESGDLDSADGIEVLEYEGNDFINTVPTRLRVKAVNELQFEEID